MERVLLYIFIAMTLITQASCKTESELISSNDPLAEYLAFGNIHNSMLEKLKKQSKQEAPKVKNSTLKIGKNYMNSKKSKFNIWTSVTLKKFFLQML